jgi:Uma2 family endonuclease
MPIRTQATIEDLYHVDGKAELINGEIVQMPPTGFLPGRTSGAIYRSLSEYEHRSKSGFAIPDNVGFHVDLPNRESFSPDAAWFTGQPTGMRFLEGAPVFAVEVRSDEDYGPRAERRLADKRRDYFAAGTRCVWDVDLLSPDVIKAYHADNPESPVRFRRGDMVNAGDAVPGWSMPVDDLFQDNE